MLFVFFSYQIWTKLLNILSKAEEFSISFIVLTESHSFACNNRISYPFFIALFRGNNNLYSLHIHTFSAEIWGQISHILTVLHRQFRSQKCGFYRMPNVRVFFYYVDFNCDVHTFITDGYLQLITKILNQLNCFKVDSMKLRVCPLFRQCAAKVYFSDNNYHYNKKNFFQIFTQFFFFLPFFSCINFIHSLKIYWPFLAQFFLSTSFLSLIT